MVSEVLTPATSYQAAFRASQESQQATTAPWLNLLRENALARFDEVGFPSVKDEEWKYTNVAPIAKTEFDTKPEGSAHTIDLGAYAVPEADASRLVFVNGILNDELSSLGGLPADVVAMDLISAANHEQYGEIV